MKTPESNALGNLLCKSLSPAPAPLCRCSRHISPPANLEKSLDLKKWITFKRHDDDEYWDEIKLVTHPRWKESELSGDEWRFSVGVEFYRKGHLVYSTGFNSMEYAMKALATLPDKMRWGSGEGEFKQLPQELDNSYCFNPGCREKATVEYKLKKEYCQVAPHDGGHEPHFDVRRRFCAKHKTRGDCGFEDSDMNYEEVPLSVKES